MPERSLVGVVDAVNGVDEARVMPEGSFLHRIVGADGITQVTALADQPTDATPGLVIKSSDLRDIKELLALILLELRDRK